MPGGCLVNLNARLYDSEIGKFLTPDPVAGDIFLPNAFNRYAYVLDDPLSLTDTSGLCFLGCFWKSSIFKAVFSTALFAVGLPELSALESAAGISALVSPAILAATNGALLGAVNAGVTGGNILQGALFGNLSAGAARLIGVPLGAVFSRALGTTIGAFVGQGVAGGIVSVAEGGSFGSGFLAAGFETLAGQWQGEQFNTGHFIAGAVLGGVGSVLGGGKFANGAVTGAFAYAASADYNEQVNGTGATSTNPAYGTKYWDLITGKSALFSTSMEHTGRIRLPDICWDQHYSYTW